MRTMDETPTNKPFNTTEVNDKSTLDIKQFVPHCHSNILTNKAEKQHHYFYGKSLLFHL